ncbi:MAG TPA: nucleotidyltransferase domain-containing protein [Herpetosiphonaceae bacterium]
MIQEQVRVVLDSIEREEDVRIFYACESGSRAWGFPSADSDYDVRFLYVHPTTWYLSIDVETRRDVIERPINDQLDVVGWDLRKALKLFRKSNPPLLEWLNSPIVYAERFEIADRLRTLLPDYYSPTASFYHYLHMAQGNFRDYLRGETVWIKKYFYVLRPLLAMKWIEAGRGIVPMEFAILVEQMVDQPDVRREIDILLERKKQGQELDREPRIAVISDFIERELERLAAQTIRNTEAQPPIEKLNEVFLWALQQAPEQEL